MRRRQRAVLTSGPLRLCCSNLLRRRGLDKAMLRIPRRHGHFVFGVIQSGLTSAIAAGVASIPFLGTFAFIENWLGSWLIAWMTTIPIVILAAPAIRRLVLALTNDSPTMARACEGSDQPMSNRLRQTRLTVCSRLQSAPQPSIRPRSVASPRPLPQRFIPRLRCGLQNLAHTTCRCGLRQIAGTCLQANRALSKWRQKAGSHALPPSSVRPTKT